MYFIFDIIIKVMAFDFLPVADFVDFGFRETEPWNSKFDWLGYGSTNFVESLGSIVIFITIIIL